MHKLIPFAALLLAACQKDVRQPTGAPPAAAGTSVTVQLQPKSDSTVSGTATFSDRGEGVRVFVEVHGASPGLHGIHVHENGDCSDPKAESAGGHFAPEQHPHGLPGTEPRHLGDLGNIEVGPDGKGLLDVTVAAANLKDGDPHSFRNRALVIHAGPDQGTQPSGDAGGRIACAVIH